MDEYEGKIKDILYPLYRRKVRVDTAYKQLTEIIEQMIEQETEDAIWHATIGSE